MKSMFTMTNVTAGLIAFVFVGLGALTFSLPHFQKNITLATSAVPEKFTELYFEDHLNLTRAAVLKEPQTFSFTIHNLEYKTMEYPYEIYVQDIAGSRSGIITNSVTLRHDQQKTITESFEILEPIKRAKVVVNLTNKNQEIHYWIGEDNK